jgi:3-mercaptopyruvate sulfurtransferase SseA
MIRLVGPQAVAEWIGKPEFVIVDPRRPMKYLSGHLSGAVNLPVYRAFGESGALLERAALAEWLGAAGVGEGVTPVLYDSPQGQNAAMLAWIMEYLGAPDTLLLEVFFERWKSEGRDVAYRPVNPTARRFTPRPDERLRATLDEPSGAYSARGQYRMARSERARGPAARSPRTARASIRRGRNRARSAGRRLLPQRTPSGARLPRAHAGGL